MAKSKGYSEADMGDMSHYDPNLGVGKKGMKAMMAPAPMPKRKGMHGTPMKMPGSTTPGMKRAKSAFAKMTKGRKSKSK